MKSTFPFRNCPRSFTKTLHLPLVLSRFCSCSFLETHFSLPPSSHLSSCYLFPSSNVFFGGLLFRGPPNICYLFPPPLVLVVGVPFGGFKIWITTTHTDLFSFLISDIKFYSWNDPHIPWLIGIRKMKDTLPQHLLREKLPRFLQKCAESFDSNRQYRNDLRYIMIWMQLMDYVDDPMALLRTMEMKKKLGLRRASFTWRMRFIMRRLRSLMKLINCID